MVYGLGCGQHFYNEDHINTIQPNKLQLAQKFQTRLLSEFPIGSYLNQVHVCLQWPSWLVARDTGHNYGRVSPKFGCNWRSHFRQEDLQVNSPRVLC